MKNTKKYIKPSDNFWKENFMKVLEAMYWEEGTHAMDYWDKYGVSNTDKKKIYMTFWNRINRKQK